MILKRMILCSLLCMVTIQAFPVSYSEENIIDQFTLGHISNEMMRFGHSENSKKILYDNATLLIKDNLNKSELNESDKLFIPKIVELYGNKHSEILEDPIYFQQVKNIFKKHMSHSEIMALWTAPSPPHEDIYIKYANASLEVSRFSSTFIKERLNDQIFLEKYQFEIQQILNKIEDDQSISTR